MFDFHYSSGLGGGVDSGNVDTMCYNCINFLVD